MKGVSDVIAVLLMLIITIALAGLAYAYITGVFASRTAVVLNPAGEGSCASGQTTNALLFSVRNDGSSKSGTLSWTAVPGNPSSISSCTFDPTTLNASEVATVKCTRSATGRGYYQIRVSAPGATPATLGAYCAS